MGILVRNKRQLQQRKMVLNEKLRLHIERELAARAANQPFLRRPGGNKASG